MIKSQQRSSNIMETAIRPSIIMRKGHGSWVYDTQGKKYLDFIQGWGVNCLGHTHPIMVDAITSQAGLMLNASPAFYNEPQLKLASILAEESHMNKVFFANSGAEANEGAIKLARKWGQIHANGAYEIITFNHSFHGRTLTTMAASGKPQWKKLFEPKTPGFIKVPFNNSHHVKKAVSDKTVAIMLELIQGEGGVIPAKTAFLKDLKDIADQHHLLIIIDEIQTGMGRTGSLFAFQDSPITPDILTLGKGLGGGLPISALISTSRVDCFEPGDQGGTFNGNSFVTHVAAKVIKEILNPSVLTHVNDMGQYMKDQLHTLSQKFSFGKVRGKGLLLALGLGQPISEKIVKQSLEEGLLINAPKPDTLRFLPSLLVTKEEVDIMMNILGHVIQQVFRKK